LSGYSSERRPLKERSWKWRRRDTGSTAEAHWKRKPAWNPTAPTEAAFIAEWPCPAPENALGFPGDPDGPDDERACFTAKRDPRAAPTMRTMVLAAAPVAAAGFSVEEIGVMDVAKGRPNNPEAVDVEFTREVGLLVREDEDDVAGPGTRAPAGTTSASTPEKR
jgi:hypothetical protein